MSPNRLRNLAGWTLSILLGAATPAWAQEKTSPSAENPSTVTNWTVDRLPSASPESAKDHAAEEHTGFFDCRNSFGPGGFFVDAEYMLMQPRRRAQDFAVVSPVSTGTPIGSVESLNLEADSGIRVGGGWREEGWDVGAYYATFHSATNRLLQAPTGGTLFATATVPGGGIEVATAAAAGGDLNSNILDLEFGRNFLVAESFTLRLFGGGRFAWINQNFNVFYNGGDANNAFITSPIDFDGAGIRVGGEGRWNVRWGLNLYARASGSLLAGTFRTSLTETNNNGATVDANVTEKFDKIVPVAEFGLGIAWEYRNFQARIGYEMSNWFGLVDSPDFVSDINQGKYVRRVSDLSLDGFVVQAGISF